jgi:hypothetical protein
MAIMKLIGVCTLIVLCCLSTAEAQEVDIKNNKYKVWLSLIDKPYEVNGVLNELKDSTILLANYKTFSEFIIDNNPTIELGISNIDLIEVRKKSRLGTSIVIGTVSGFAVGGLIGLARGDDSESTKGEKAILGGVSLAIPGALVGMLIGAVKISFPIEGSLLNFKSHKKELLKYSTY